MKKGSDPSNDPLKIFLFGPWGGGKTFSIVGLLLEGLKVMVITTDVGGSGTLSVKLYLRQIGKAELLDNLYEVVLNGDEDVQKFLNEPLSLIPELYDMDLDWLVWDGFSGWQQVDLSERIGEMPTERRGEKELPAAVEAGLQFETAQWGMIRNATFRAIGKFCAMRNKKTGRVWDKIVTAQEGYKSKNIQGGSNQQSKLEETHLPLVQGAGGILMGGAFDLIIRVHEEKERDNKGNVASKYYYSLKGENSMSKNRGFKLPNQMPADMGALYRELKSQMGVIRQEGAEENVVTSESN